MTDSNSTFGSLRRQERESRRQIILEAAERVFGSKPFTQVPMRGIAGEAGISPASIYRYYPDQQSLFIEAFLQGADQITGTLDAITAAPGENATMEAAEAFIQYLADNGHYFRMMTHFMLDGSLDEEQAGRLNAAERTLLEHFDRLFEAGLPQKQARLYSHAFFAALNGILITFWQYPGRSREELLDHMKELGRIVADLFRKGSAG